MGGRGGSSGFSGGSGGGNSPILSGKPESIETVYHRNTYYGSAYDDEALDASFDKKTGELKFDYAKDKDWDNTHSTNKRQGLTITVENGMINGKLINVDLGSKKIKAISAPNLSEKAQETLKKSGFDFNSASKKWEKGYKGYSVSGNTLHVDSKLPNNFSSYSRIKTKYGAVDTKPIKAAGFKWNGIDKVWEKK